MPLETTLVLLGAAALAVLICLLVMRNRSRHKADSDDAGAAWVADDRPNNSHGPDWGEGGGDSGGDGGGE